MKAIFMTREKTKLYTLRRLPTVCSVFLWNSFWQIYSSPNDLIFGKRVLTYWEIGSKIGTLVTLSTYKSTDHSTKIGNKL